MLAGGVLKLISHHAELAGTVLCTTMTRCFMQQLSTQTTLKPSWWRGRDVMHKGIWMKY